MKVKLIKKTDEAKGTKSFYWECEKPFSYLPGQYSYFTLPKLAYPDTRGETRHFTLSSSPTETPYICLTTRIREESGYKKTLDQLAVGEMVEMEGPNGEFTLNEKDPQPRIFIAGGIGVTPFRSMMKYIIDKKLSIPVSLIYSNSIPEEITFKTELESFTKALPYLKVFNTITKPEESKIPWRGLTGRIDATLINKIVPTENLKLSTFWVCGPPAMTDTLVETLEQMGIPDNRIYYEKFTGY